MSCTSIAHRWQTKRLRAIGRATTDIDIDCLAKRIVARLRSIRAHTQAGAYLLADSERYVYVLPEASGTTEQWVRQCPGMIVGRYACGKPLYPEVAQIIDDMLCHFVT